MDKRLHVKETKGSITVFLSLILLLILSLILTVIEGARVATAKVYAERALTTAMDSVLADYYGPLWDEYHIFGYYLGGNDDAEHKLQIEANLDEYMSYTFYPNKNLSGLKYAKGIELYDITMDRLSVSNRTGLMDYDGKLFIYEAVEYMKYKKLGDGAKSLLNQLSLLEAPAKVTYLMDEKMEAQEKLVEIDLGILELMELFDGLNTNMKGIEFTKNGGFHTNSEFIKKICYEEVTMESVGINQEAIYQTQKDYYFNPNIYFTMIQNKIIEIEGIVPQIEQNRLVYQEEQEKLSGEKLTLSKLEAKEKKTIEDKQKIKLSKSNIKSYESALKSLEVNIYELEYSITKKVNTVTTTRSEITKLLNELKPLINKAISTIDHILYQIEHVAPIITQYENMLITEKDNLIDQVYEGLEEGLEELKKYVVGDNNGYNFKNMKLILEQNLKILIDTEEMLSPAEVNLWNRSYSQSKLYFKTAENILTGYQIRGLTLDYSTLIVDQSGVKSPVEKARNLLQGSILNLVLNTDKISNSKMDTTKLLPSELAMLQKLDKDFMSSLSSLMNNAATSIKDLNLSNLFGALSDDSEIVSLLEEGVNKAAEIILFQEYIKDHFGLFQASVDSKQIVKPSVLNYEQEYLLIGKATDQDNLASMVSRIVTLRTVFDFVSILGDKSKRDEAKIIAASLVGFTGLPILVSITQVLILVVWSFAEALLDICALLLGKEVPIFKNKIHMEFPELFLINQEYLQQKAMKMTDTNQVTLTYQDYIQVFLLLKGKKELAYRSMDLIQENIRLRYRENTFLITNCLFGYEVDADFIIKSKFTGFPFIKNSLGYKQEGFPFKIKASYSY